MKNKIALLFLVSSITVTQILTAELVDDYNHQKQNLIEPPKPVEDISTNSEISGAQEQNVPTLGTQINELPELINADPEVPNVQDKKEIAEIRPGDLLPEPTNVEKQSERVESEVSTSSEVLASNAQNMQEDQTLEPEDEILTSNQEETSTDTENKAEELSTLFGISFDKKQLMYYGAGAFALITICGVVAYVLYKDGTYKKVGDYIHEHKFAVSSAIGAVCILAIAGIYAKQQGITLQSTGNWITSLFGFNKTESI